MIINIAGGTGVMGRIYKPALESAGHKVILSGRNTIPGLEEAAKQADLTIISVPISATEEVIKKVAPYCKAIMDFTSLKKFPVEAMLRYSSKNCEVAGLHPLHGEVSSIAGKTIIYCETERTGEKCKEVIKSLELFGAKIKKMIPEEHDRYITGFIQNARRKILEVCGLLLKETGLSIQEVLEISPPPTKVLISLLARQIDEKNDEMWKSMIDLSPFESEANEKLSEFLKRENDNDGDVPRELREYFGEQLKKQQEIAKKLIESV